MGASNVAALHEEACRDLSELVQRRSRALRKLEKMAKAAAEIKPSTGIVVEFELERARDILAEVEELAPELAAGVVRVNRHARKIGKRQIHWMKFDPEKE